MSFEQLRRSFRRVTNQDWRAAVLGDADGVIYEPGKPGYVRVRYPVAAGEYSAPVLARMRASVPVEPGAAVKVGYDEDNELAVVAMDFAGQVEQGRNPLLANAADRRLYGYTSQSQIPTLLSGPVSTPATDSTDVWVLSYFWIDADGDAHFFAGERVELAAYIPAAGTHRLAGLFLDPATDAIEVNASTAKAIADPLTVAEDVQECIDAATAGVIPIWFWRLADAQTRVTDTDSWLDARQLINGVAGVVGGADHGALVGLGDDDHIQYSLVSGARAFTGTVGGVTPVASSDLATKEYVDTAVAALRLEYFLTDTASGIGSYYDALPTLTGEAESTFTTAGLGAGDDQLLTSWITPDPGIDALEVGVYVLHIHAAKTAGTKPVTLYWTLERRTAGGVETTVMTSEDSGAVTTAASIELHANLSTQFDLDAGDRLVVNVFANVGAAGSDVTVALYAEGTTGSHFTIVTSTGGLLTVEEVDGAPSVSGVRRIVVTNGTLTDDGDGQVTLDTGGGALALDDLSDVDAAAPNDGDVLTYDSGSGDWINAAPGGGLDPSLSYGPNLVKNYPSLERADSAQPEWWEVSASGASGIVLTEEDATGETIADLYERVLKGVTGASGAGQYFYQSWTLADEPLLDASAAEVSAGAWVYVVTAGTLTLRLYDTGGAASLGTATTTTTGSWVRLELENVTIGTTGLELRFEHSANSATFYVAMPSLHIGPTCQPWTPRGLLYRERYGAQVLNTDPADTNWHDLDLTASTSPLAVVVQIVTKTFNSASSFSDSYVRRNGSSEGQTSATSSSAGSNTVYPNNTLSCMMDDGQIIEWSVDNSSVSTFRISVLGFWEWET